LPRDLAIDLGTANTLVYARGHGVVLNEPSVVAINTNTNELLAVGQKARRMLGRTPANLVARRPLRTVANTDFEVTMDMTLILLRQVGVTKINRARVVVCVPSAITPVERRAVMEAARRAGATEVRLMDQPVAAAIGVGLPIDEPVGSMVIDIGGGTTQTALLSLGGVVALEAVRVGSFDIDDAIQTHMRREYGMAVGESTAEQTKILVGSAAPTSNETAAEIRGRELMSGMPKIAVVTPDEIREAIEEPVSAMVDSVLSCLSQSPPELALDLIARGVYLVGGGGLLKGMDTRLSEATSLQVKRVNAPLETVVNGAGRCLEQLGMDFSIFNEEFG